MSDFLKATNLIYMSDHPKLLATYEHLIKIKRVQRNSWAGMFNTKKNKLRSAMAERGLARFVTQLRTIIGEGCSFELLDSNENDINTYPKKKLIIYRKK